MKSHFFTFILCVCIQTKLLATIDYVHIRWNPLRCQSTCVALVEKNLKQLPITEITVNEKLGQAELKWKSKAPFSFSELNTAMRLVGLSMTDVRLKVTGKLQHTSTTVVLISSDDGTHFELLNPIVPSMTGQISQNNLSTRTLKTELRGQLIDGEMKKQIATIEGTLFMPERNYSPIKLVVEYLNFKEQVNEASDNKRATIKGVK